MRRESALALGVVLVAVLCSGQSCTPNGVTPLSAPIDDSIVDSNPILPAGISLTANAGQDQIVHENDVVTLHVTVNPEVDSRSLMYLWKQDAGPAVVLSGSTGSIATFIAPNVDEDTSFVFTVTVSNGTGSVSDSVMITVLKTIDIAGNEPEFAPTIELSSNVTEGEAPLAVTFTAEIMQPGGGASDASCTWSFGDGTQAQGYSVNHTYSTAGSYIVTACITMSAGTMSCAEKTVKVTPAAAAVGGGGGGGGVVLPEPQVTYKISGRLLKADATPLIAAVVSADHNGGTTTTNDQGYYELTLNAGWTGTITPQRVGYAFTPANRSYTPLAADVTHDDYLAQPPANQPPVADGQSVSVVQSTATQITLTGGDAENQALTFEIVSAPTHGTLSEVTGVSASSARVTYTPASGYTGTDSFTFRVNDGSDVSPAATVNMTVTALPPSASYYVDTNNAAAADTNPGTAALPFKTIQKAANVVQAGDTVYVKAGTYSEYVKITRSGTADHRITFRNYQNDVVILDGGNTKAESVLIGTSLVNGQGSYVTVDGFEITNYTTNGIHMYNNVGGVLRNLNVHDNAATGIALHGGITDAVVEYCHVHHNGGIGVYSVEAGGANPGRPTNSTVRHSYIHHNGQINMENGDGVNFYRTHGGEMAYNVVHDNGDDGLDCVRNTHNVNIHHNIVFRHMGQIAAAGGDGNGIKVDTSSDIAFGPAGSHVIHHNISFCNSRGGTDYDVTLGQAGNNYYNNTLFFNGYAGIILDISSRSTQLNILRNNILKENAQRRGVPFGGTKSEVYASQTASVMDSDYNFIGDGKFSYSNGVDQEGAHSLTANGVVGDPLLVDPYWIDWTTGVVSNSMGELNTAWQGSTQLTLDSIRSQVERAFSLQTVAGGFPANSPCLNAGELISGITDGFSGMAPDMGAVEMVQ